MVRVAGQQYLKDHTFFSHYILPYFLTLFCSSSCYYMSHSLVDSNQFWELLTYKLNPHLSFVIPVNHQKHITHNGELDPALTVLATYRLHLYLCVYSANHNLYLISQKHIWMKEWIQWYIHIQYICTVCMYVRMYLCMDKYERRDTTREKMQVQRGKLAMNDLEYKI